MNACHDACVCVESRLVTSDAQVDRRAFGEMNSRPFWARMMTRMRISSYVRSGEGEKHGTGGFSCATLSFRVIWSF